MTKEELVKQYADKKLSENLRNAYKNTPLGMQKALTNFDGYDIEQAYEDGFDKAVELACEWLESVNLYWYEIREGVFSKELIEDFKKHLEEQV